MPRGGPLVESLVFHGIVVGVFVFGMPYLSRDSVPPEPILTVEIVNTVPETNLDEGVDVKPVEKPAPKPEEDIDTAAEPPPPPPAPPPPLHQRPRRKQLSRRQKLPMRFLCHHQNRNPLPHRSLKNPKQSQSRSRRHLKNR